MVYMAHTSDPFVTLREGVKEESYFQVKSSCSECGIGSTDLLQTSTRVQDSISVPIASRHGTTVLALIRRARWKVSFTLLPEHIQTCLTLQCSPITMWLTILQFMIQHSCQLPPNLHNGRSPTWIKSMRLWSLMLELSADMHVSATYDE